MVDRDGGSSARAWWQILIAGALLYGMGLVLLAETGNPMLFPLVSLLGSFTVPVSYVAFFYDRRGSSPVSLTTAALAFVFGGVLGAYAASLLEPIFVAGRPGPLAFSAIGLIEEYVKIIGVVLIARHARHSSVIDGIIIGAAAGMGFAAFESSGYTFGVFLGSRGNLWAITEITVLRGLLAPLGHGTWTALLAAVLFRDSTADRFRLTAGVIGTYLGVSALHALWDMFPVLALSHNLSHSSLYVAQGLVGVIGILILAIVWKRSKRIQAAEDVTANASSTSAQEGEAVPK
jgi:protease PrsW